MAGKGSFGSLWRAGASLSALTLVSRVLGLLREMTKAAFLGTSPLADAFGIAFMIPNLFRRLFAENSISVAFIPAFRALLEEDGNKAESLRRAARFVGAVFTVVSFLTALIVGIGIIAAPLIVPFFYDRTQTVTLTEMTLLTRIMFPYLLVISIAAFFQGILNTLKIFAPSGFTPILFNIIVIGGTYLLSPHTANPARAMAIGVIVGGCVQALFQLPFVLRQGWRIAPCSLRAAFANPGVRIVLARIAPTIVGMAAYQLNDLVSTALAGNAGPGIVASLQYSLRLQELMLGVFAVSIGTVILPDLSGMAQREEWGGFNDMLAHSIRIIALITIPVTFFSLVTGREIITFIYRGGGFGDRSVSLTLRVFLCHISGLFFIAANRIIAPA
ncbi:MAG: murein biosynthesis integral membrane protein MurJ, partial [Spirochaetaceae bacterium]|nr:murein biosynthesis integral membrane protein MurJ [Spirochaetaceae bacterium]